MTLPRTTLGLFLGLMVTATLCAWFAFMLPVATPPNAIVFSSRCVHIPQMPRAGLWLSFLGVS
jgi:sodium-dependent dicarboxylate transporter 2/3/5